MSEGKMTQEHTSNRPGALARGSLLTAGVAVVLALFALVNYLGLRHYERFDWTGSDIYTLSEKSENLVEGLDRDVQIIVLLDPSAPSYAQVDELVDRYVAANPARIVRRDLDRAKSALEFQQLVTELGIDSANTLVVASEGEKRVIHQYELVEYDYSAAQMGGSPTIKAFKGEQEITSALLSLVEAEKPKVVFTTGHGETTLDARGMSQRSLAEARRLLGQDNFELDTWQSLGAAEVPEGTDLVVISAPTARFTPPELEVLGAWLDRGGRLLVFLEPSFEAGTTDLKDVGLSEWLSGYGVDTARDVVIDPGASLAFFGPETIYTDAFGDHPIVESLAQTLAPVMFQGASSVSAGDGPDGAEVSELVSSSEEAWGETRITEEGVAKDPDDLAGPLGLGVAVSFGGADDGASDAENSENGDGENGSDGDGDETRLVVFGDLDFATDSLLAQGANSVLFVNTFNWLVEREQLIEIEGREPEQTQLTLAGGEIYSLGAVVLLLLPASALCLGIWIALRRRR